MPTITGDSTSIRPAQFADAQGQYALNAITASRRKTMGQYFTAHPVAEFMASLAAVRQRHVRILDPGAGSGILACAACERLAEQATPPSSIYLDAYEADAAVAEVLEGVLAQLREWLHRRNIALSYRVYPEDFISANAEAFRSNDSLRSENVEPYDLVIANPPYFKVSKDSHYAHIAGDVVHGQPNIYSIFMAAGAALLKVGGQLIVISPRSFASGAYFRRFRQAFFGTVRPVRVHLFGSRRSAFDRDRVLQEWVILSAVREPGWHENEDAAEALVEVSTSMGFDDIHDQSPRRIPIHRVLDMRTPHAYFRIPVALSDDTVVDIVDSWDESLSSLGLAVSTGRVVPFRARDYLMREPGHRTVPLLWMNNITPMTVTWPLGNHKPEYFVDCADSRTRLLVPDGDYVLLRRFSSKEQVRRLVAAPLSRGMLGHAWLGFENHLNYVYQTSGHSDPLVLHGLAVLLNSSLLDTYFRILNGSTEVSATELRAIPLPARDLLRRLGQGWRVGMDAENLDDMVESVLITARGIQ